MRKLASLTFGFGALALGATLVLAQQPRFGGAGGGNDPLALLRNEQVRKELDLTDEQVEQLPDAVRKALHGVLNEKQMTRLHEIELQQRGAQAFRDKKVQSKLKLTDDQVQNIQTMLDDATKEAKEAFSGGFNKDSFAKLENLRKETAEKVQGVLTSDQRKTYKQMLGEEFKMERPRFGFGGGGGRKKGNDQ